MEKTLSAIAIALVAAAIFAVTIIAIVQSVRNRRRKRMIDGRHDHVSHSSGKHRRRHRR
ncbi:MAG: hypothetical protein K2J51_08665 [Alistipes sp.]|nr:hypothetical protein [Alistipes sp.]